MGKLRLKKIHLEKLKSEKYVVYALAALCILLTIMVGSSFATLLDNDVEVKENSPLTYYLNVSYDGVDKAGIESDNKTVADVRSGTIYVQDRIPDGLIFDGFVTTEDGSIGAVQRGTTKSCPGKVVDDTNEDVLDNGVWNEDHTEYTYHGLHYSEKTRTVTFEVKNLQAGCELTVGIKTITPTVDDPTTPEKEIRRDFYNFATASEKDLTIKSNTVHVFMGSEFATLFNVKYEYTGDVPSNAPIKPLDASYAAGTSVGVSLPLEIEGYEFSGWTTEDVEVSENGSFIMPEKDVLFRGYYTRTSENKVTYELNGVTPNGYILPSEKTYFVGSTVTVDSLKIGDIFNGYRFLGWATEDAIITDGEFEMPRKDVVLVGQFEEVTYKVSYQFHDTILPPNADSLLPDTKEFKPGAEVTLENVKSEPVGYKFLGWYKEDKFIMPEEDVVIYGEWKVQKGLFSPSITKEIINRQDYYRTGDIVNYEIIVKNNASYPIRDIMVKENNEKAYFNSSNDYELVTDRIVKIDSLGANGQIILSASYKVTDNDAGTINNEVEIIGALADDNYELDTSKEYKARDSFKVQSKVKICKEVLNSTKEKDFQFHITDNENEDMWLNIKGGTCQSVYLEPNSYDLLEVVPQEYTLKEVSLTDGENVININNGEKINIAEGKNYTITFVNEYKRKGFFHSDGKVVNKVEKIMMTTFIGFLPIINVSSTTKKNYKMKI